MKKSLALIALAAFALTSSSIAFAAAMKNGATKTVTFKIRAQNKSGEKGTATLTPQGFGTKVTISVTGEPAGASQPAHIHTGASCQNVGGVVYPLKNVVGGTSTTFINKPIATVQANGTLINIHKSAADLKDYVACGKW